MTDCIACIDEATTGMTSIGRVFPPAVVLVIYCRNSYSIDRVKHTWAGPILQQDNF